MFLSSWLWAGRARRNLQRALRPLGPIEPLVGELAPGASFVDVGAIWDVHGQIAFQAEEHGATAVTAVDVSAETDEYLRRHAERNSKVRFVQGDLHDPGVRGEIGRHDVVWCSGVLYHCPNPVHTLECLRELTGQKLVLITASLPELPGIAHGSVFWPMLSQTQRRAYVRAYDVALRVRGDSASQTPERAGLSTPFDPARSYANWWWGLTPSAIEAMLRVVGFKVAETKTNGFHTRIVADAA